MSGFFDADCGGPFGLQMKGPFLASCSSLGPLRPFLLSAFVLEVRFQALLRAVSDLPSVASTFLVFSLVLAPFLGSAYGLLQRFEEEER